MRLAVIVLSALALAGAARAEIFDRTVAVVGERAVLAGEVDAQLRLEAMFGDREVDPSAEARGRALDRLIEQRLLESDIALTNFAPVSPERRAEAQAALRAQRFGGRTFSEALAYYGLAEAQAMDFLERQLQFANFIDFRFRTGLDVPEEEIERRYRRLYDDVPGGPPLADIRERLRQELIDETAERALDSRVRQLRAETRIVLLQPVDPSAAQPEAGP